MIDNQGSEITSIFNCINEDVLKLSYRWKIYLDLFDSGEANLELLNSSGGCVFELVQYLIMDDTILALSRLTDPPKSGRDQDNANIRYLLALSKDVLNPSAVIDLNNALARLDAHVKNLRVYRHKALAHSDLHHALRMVGLPDITYVEVEGAMEECRNIVSKLGAELLNQSCNFNVLIPFGYDASHLLTLLRKAHAQNEQSGTDHV